MYRSIRSYINSLRIITGLPGTGRGKYGFNEIIPKKRVSYLLPSHDRIDEFYEKIIPINSFLIEILTGKPGEGKSKHATNEIVPIKIMYGKRTLYLLPSHERVNEFYGKMIPVKKVVNGKEVKIKRTTAVWRGFRRFCPLLRVIQEELENGKEYIEIRYILSRIFPGQEEELMKDKTFLENLEAMVKVLTLEPELPPSIICALCNRFNIRKKLPEDKKCKYYTQFNTIKRKNGKKLILTVHDYLTTSYAEEFDTIIIDDIDLTKMVEFKAPTIEEYKEILRLIRSWFSKDVLKELFPKKYKEIIEEIFGDEEKHKEFLEIVGETQEIIYNNDNLDGMRKSLDKLIEAFKIIYPENWGLRNFKSWSRLVSKLVKDMIVAKFIDDAVKLYRLFEANRFFEWLFYYSIYKKIQDYGRPYLFYAFDLVAQGKEVIIVSAEFVDKTTVRYLDDLIDRYHLENNVEIKYDVKPVPKQINNNETGTIYFYKNMNGLTGRYPVKSSLVREETLRNIVKKIRLLLKHYKLPVDGEGLGIITGKDIEEKLKKEFPKAKFAHYFNLKGTNNLSDVKLLVLVGTPEIGKENLLDIAKKIFPDKNFNDEAIKLNPLLGYKYRDPLLDRLNHVIVVMELFQAMHRARPVRRKVDVFVFAKPIVFYMKDIGVKAKWFDIDENGTLYIRDIFTAEEIRFTIGMEIIPDEEGRVKIKTQLTGDKENLGKILLMSNKKITVKQDWRIKYYPDSESETIILEKQEELSELRNLHRK